MTAGDLEEVFKLEFEPTDDKDLITVVKEEPEKKKICTLGRSHPFDPSGERLACGRPAAYAIDIANKPCGHRDITVYLCQGCWNEIEQTKDFLVACTTCVKKGVNRSGYIVKNFIVGWRKL